MENIFNIFFLIVVDFKIRFRESISAFRKICLSQRYLTRRVSKKIHAK